MSPFSNDRISSDCFFFKIYRKEKIVSCYGAFLVSVLGSHSVSKKNATIEGDRDISIFFSVSLHVAIRIE